jgi:hypothetical protein
MLKRTDWRALQALGATPAKPIQLVFDWSSPALDYKSGDLIGHKKHGHN